MSQWAEGYTSDIGYTYGYYPELNPVRCELALLQAGLKPPTIRRACELGFGQGVSINIHAAAQPTDWHGTDFNPSQVRYAKELAFKSGHSAHLSDDSFAEFADRDDLPLFDFIGLHGIWSWINDTNRETLIRFLRNRLAVGGVVYVSYNTLPGWAAFAPIRHLMVQHAAVLSAGGVGSAEKVGQAVAFAQRMLEAKPVFARANPGVVERMAKVAKNNRSYLAHEYFNRDWRPFYFAEMHDCMAAAKLQFACSANPMDLFDDVNLTTEQRALLREVRDPAFRQGLRDFLVNQQFRKDYWIRGAVEVTRTEREQALRAHRVVLSVPRSKIGWKLNTVLGEITLKKEIYEPVVDCLADHRPRSLGDIERELAPKSITLSMICEVVLILSSAGHVSSAQSEAQIQAATPRVTALNQALMTQAQDSADVGFLACAVTGGGVPVNRIEQLMLAAQQQKPVHGDELAKTVWAVLQSRGHRMVREGVRLESEADNLAELNRMGQDFTDVTLPMLRALGMTGPRTAAG